MIPISLEINGIYSYQAKPTKIDFEKLSKANIFGIFGEVGSGKSTILEAITIALYGETERLNLKDNRNYNMMNLKSNELFIDFHFKAENGKLFRFTKKTKRNKRSFSKVETLVSKHYEYINNDWQPTEKTAEEIIGLNYENFKKTIIIHQDKFKEFIQLTSTSRSEMLKELFGLHKYDLTNKAKILENKNDLQINQIETQLTELGFIDEKQIEIKEKEIADKGDAIKILSKELEIKKEQKIQLDSIKEIFETIESKNQEHLSLLAKSEDFKKLQEQIDDYELCKSKFKDLLNRKKDESNLHKKKSRELNNQKIQLENVQAETLKEEELFEKIGVDYEKRLDLKTKQEDLQKIIELQESKKSLSVLSQQKASIEKQLQESELIIKSLGDSVIKIKTEIKAKNKILPNYTVLNEMSQWFSKKSRIEENQHSLYLEIKKKEQDFDKLQKQKSEKLKDFTLDTDNTTESSIQKILQKMGILEEEVKLLDSKILHYKLNQKLKDYAEKLQSGEPCPLCGSKEHPQILDIKSLESELQSASAKKSKLEEDAAKLRNTRIYLENIRAKEEDYNTFLKEKSEEEKKLKKSYAALLETFVWKPYTQNDENKVQEEIKRSQILRDEIKKLETDRETLEKELEVKNATNEKNKNIANEKTIAITKVFSKIEELSNFIKLLKQDEYIHLSKSNLEIQMKNWKQKIDDIVKTYESKNKIVTQLKAYWNKLEGEIESNTNHLSESEKNLKTLETELEKALSNSKFSNIQEVEKILTQEFNVDSARAEVNNYHKNVNHIEQNLKELRNKVEGKSYDSVLHKELNFEIEEKFTVLEKTKKELHELTFEIKNWKSNLQKKRVLEEKYILLKDRKKDISELKNLFHGQGFVNYVSRLFLKDICNSANERFYKLTNQNLKLELMDDNNFQVRDYINDGEVRSVKTLSGGQTFQAALSLALSLSDRIQRLSSSKENFFFIDEGFGSLDKESLSIVFETLKSLRKENRIVGVISHVEEMQDEIPMFIKVKNDKITGSSIKGSWE
ncbi:MAG: AAA family ATPase [Leptospiraceae bacterium]|nr:AAA family ATPase [Leptospiraceae bacterium]MCP5496123.1 AAA family ATPase [Leptospiraceae bacterium]